jgi:hypothetical protein
MSLVTVKNRMMELLFLFRQIVMTSRGNEQPFRQIYYDEISHVTCNPKYGPWDRFGHHFLRRGDIERTKNAFRIYFGNGMDRYKCTLGGISPPSATEHRSCDRPSRFSPSATSFSSPKLTGHSRNAGIFNRSRPKLSIKRKRSIRNGRYVENYETRSRARKTFIKR